MGKWWPKEVRDIRKSLPSKYPLKKIEEIEIIDYWKGNNPCSFPIICITQDINENYIGKLTTAFIQTPNYWDFRKEPWHPWSLRKGIRVGTILINQFKIGIKKFEEVYDHKSEALLTPSEDKRAIIHSTVFQGNTLRFFIQRQHGTFMYRMHWFRKELVNDKWEFLWNAGGFAWERTNAERIFKGCKKMLKILEERFNKEE